MTEPNKERPFDLGVYDGPSSPKITAIEVIAAALTLLWFVGIAAFFLTLDTSDALPDDGSRGLRVIMILMAVFLPIALIWVARILLKAGAVRPAWQNTDTMR